MQYEQVFLETAKYHESQVLTIAVELFEFNHDLEEVSQFHFSNNSFSSFICPQWG